MLPVARPERSLHGLRGVAAALGGGGEGVLLFEREPCRQEAEPGAGAGERLAADSPRRLGVGVPEELEHAPGDAALAPLEERLPGPNAARADEGVRVLLGSEPVWIEDEERRA